VKETGPDLTPSSLARSWQPNRGRTSAPIHNRDIVDLRRGSTTRAAGAQLMVDPECCARCALRDTRAPGTDRYHWSVTLADWLEGAWVGLAEAPDDDRRGDTGVAIVAARRPGKTVNRPRYHSCSH